MKTKNLVVKKTVVNPKLVEAIHGLNKLINSKDGYHFWDVMEELEHQNFSTKVSIKSMPAIDISAVLGYLIKGKAFMQKMCAYLDKYGDVIG